MEDMYAAVIHDVKNQLAELSLRLGERGDAQREMLIAMSAARQLSKMLLVHRQSAGALSVNADSVDTSGFMAILAAEYRELFPRLQIWVDATDAPAFAFFDDALVRMALANAMHNACRHAAQKVELSARQQDGMLVFEIADDGPGFPLGVLAQGGLAPSDVSARGTGLGLYLAGKIAALHCLHGRCGHVDLANAGGAGGARFRMMLP
ncbi:MAG: sensor histidine kinase [Gallionella sp.]|nr:sensor histidine kinase [Gallionella sp.]